jgi:hypothetical protein
MICRQCGTPAYSSPCPVCLKKKGANPPQAREKTDAQKFWEDIFKTNSEYKEYNTTEIDEAMELVFAHVKEIVVPQDRWKMNKAGFGELLQMSINMGMIPTFFNARLTQIRKRNTEAGGHGTEILKTLGLLPAVQTEILNTELPSSNERIISEEDIPF